LTWGPYTCNLEELGQVVLNLERERKGSTVLSLADQAKCLARNQREGGRTDPGRGTGK